jgi:hypothetical protein
VNSKERLKLVGATPDYRDFFSVVIVLDERSSEHFLFLLARTTTKKRKNDVASNLYLKNRRTYDMMRCANRLLITTDERQTISTEKKEREGHRPKLVKKTGTSVTSH